MAIEEEIKKFMEEDYFDEEVAIAELLKDGILFCNYRMYNQEWNEKIWEDIVDLTGPTIVLFLNCNDTFYWASADSECVGSSKELKELHMMWKEDKIYGPTWWVCKKRNMRPQLPLLKRMKEKGVWTPLMESLPERTDGL